MTVEYYSYSYGHFTCVGPLPLPHISNLAKRMKD